MSLDLERAIEEVTRTQIELATSAQQEFRKAVRELALGNEVNLKRLAAQMSDLDLSPTDLREAIEKQRRRFDVGRQLEDLPQLQQRLEAASKEHAELAAELDAVSKRLGPLINDAAGRVIGIESKLKTLENAREQLAAECDDPSLLDEQRRLDERASTIGVQVRSLSRAIREKNDSIQSYRTELSESSDSERIEKAIERLTKEVEGLQTEHDALDEQLAAIGTEQAELDARKALP